MQTLIWLSAGLLVFSKFMDCWSTATQLTDISQERNPRARKLMRRFGVKTAIWGVFGITVILVGFSLWLSLEIFDFWFYQLTHVFMTTVLTILHVAVVHTNYTRKLNFFTKYLTKVMR